MAELDEYNRKRDFERTAEPRGEARRASNDLPRFVVQKHAARRLHYDVRFEINAVMPSWAVPQGPSYDPSVKRLAVHTEDHPLDYQTFEGTIPKGEYGGGNVIIWDNGTYENISHKGARKIAIDKAIESGHFSVEFHGEKLNGSWSFTRTSKPGDRRESWIMVKRKDGSERSDYDVTGERPESVVSSKTVEQVGQSEAEWRQPMLATLSDKIPVGDDWSFEPKLDGLRCIAIKRGNQVDLWSRNHLSYNARFPHIRAALQRLGIEQFVFDGELVNYEQSRTSFSALQQNGSSVLCLFDVLSLLGRDVTALPMEERKALLAKAIVPDDVLQLIEPIEGTGEELLQKACREGLEGLVAKRKGSTYTTGRSRDWLKLKCTASQELVIGGWTEPKGARNGLGALLVGHFEDDELRYAGKVGTGFSQQLLNELYEKLASIELEQSPFADRIRETTAHWCKPELIAQIGFMEWTSDGKLRHPRFEGLREDKNPREVKREKS